MSRKAGPFLGKWWVAGNKDQSVGGRLDLADSFSLHTVEGLKSESGVGVQDMSRFIVEGESLGTCITLFECIGSRHTYSNRQTQHEVFSPTVLTGPRHFDDPGCSKFDRISFRLDNLNQFTNRRSFKTSHAPGDIFTVTHSVVPDLVAQLDGANVMISPTTERSVGLNRIELTSTECFYIELSERRSLEELMYKYIRPLRYLITLATATDCGIHDLWVADTKTLEEDRHGYFEVHLWKSKPEDLTRRVVNPNMRFSLHSDIRRPTFPFEDMVPRWFQISEKYGPALDLIFSLRTSVGYLESKVFAIASALEAVHQKLFPEAGKRTPEQNMRLQEILGCAPSAHVEWLRKALANSHQPSYSQRVRELLNYAGEPMARTISKLNEWVILVANARNGIAHARGVNDDEIVRTINLMRSIQMLAEALLLKELGLTASEFMWLAEHDFEWRAVRPGLVDSYPHIF